MGGEHWNMGELRHLTERERRRRVTSVEGPAKILLFTGVRIERRESTLADRLPPIEEPEKRVSSE